MTGHLLIGRGSHAQDPDAILAQVADLLAAHRIPAAERLLTDLLTDSVLTAATPQQRRRILR